MIALASAGVRHLRSLLKKLILLLVRPSPGYDTVGQRLLLERIHEFPRLDLRGRDQGLDAALRSLVKFPVFRLDFLILRQECLFRSINIAAPLPVQGFFI